VTIRSCNLLPLSRTQKPGEDHKPPLLRKTPPLPSQTFPESPFINFRCAEILRAPPLFSPSLHLRFARCRPSSPGSPFSTFPKKMFFFRASAARPRIRPSFLPSSCVLTPLPGAGFAEDACYQSPAPSVQIFPFGFCGTTQSIFPFLEDRIPLCRFVDPFYYKRDPSISPTMPPCFSPYSGTLVKPLLSQRLGR